MAGVSKHKKTTSPTVTIDPTDVGGLDWNTEHAFAGGNHGSLLIRDTGETDGANWVASVAAGQVLASQGAGGIPAWSAAPLLSAVQFLLTDPSAPVNGQFWVMTTGTTPTATWYLKARLQGTTVTLMSGPF